MPNISDELLNKVVAILENGTFSNIRFGDIYRVIGELLEAKNNVEKNGGEDD